MLSSISKAHPIHFYMRYMMNKLILSLSLFLLSFLFISCSGQEGTAEQMGKKIDESIDSSKKAIDEVIEKAAKKIEEVGDTSQGPAEQMGEKIDETVESLKDAMSKTFEDAPEKIEEASDTLKEKADAVDSGY
jgi:ElaB/YqjD/DUF883 family membrane-anchored ribosome-binding protein